MAVADSRDPVLAPAVGAAPRLVMREIIPSVSVGTVILAHRSPLPLREIRPPALPVYFALARFLQSDLFFGHNFPPSGFLMITAVASLLLNCSLRQRFCPAAD